MREYLAYLSTCLPDPIPELYDDIPFSLCIFFLLLSYPRLIKQRHSSHEYLGTNPLTLRGL